MPKMERLGSTALPLVTSTHVDTPTAPPARVPVAGLKVRPVLLPLPKTMELPARPVVSAAPMRTLLSFVPSMATLSYFGENLTWLMYERLPSVCFVTFGGLFTYHVTAPPLPLALPVIVSQTRVVAARRCPQPPPGAAAGQS